MEAGADVQQGGDTAVSETDTQQIATLAQVRHSYVYIVSAFSVSSLILVYLPSCRFPWQPDKHQLQHPQ